MWECFFNWQMDMDWAWGPFLALRPARETPIQPWVWTRLFVVFTVLGLLLLALGVVCVVLLPKWAAWEHWALPPGVSETLATLTAMGTDRGFQEVLAGVVLSLPGLFFLACLPFHLAWNRRATQLAQEPPTGLSIHMLLSSADVWPPAPKRAE
jgi:hypothetical protein